MNTQQPTHISEYYIAYFDILGYQDFFKETPDKVQDFLNTIHSAITKTIYSVKSFNESSLVPQDANLHIQSKIFSDNILLCIEVGSDISIEKFRLISFMALVSEIQRKFIIEYGLFLRGGLTKGKVSFNNDYIFGEGVIEAVKMEESTKYPRIAVSKEVVSFLNKIQLYSQEEADRAISIENRYKSGEQISEDDNIFYQKIFHLCKQEALVYNVYKDLLYQCADDVQCLSYLHCIDIRYYIPEITLEQVKELVKQVAPEDYKRLSLTFPDIDKILEFHRNIIERKLVKYSDYSKFSTDDVKGFETQERILKKYVWSMVYHNDMCDSYNKKEHFINTQGNCERRHMKLVIHVLNKDGIILNKC